MHIRIYQRHRERWKWGPTGVNLAEWLQPCWVILPSPKQLCLIKLICHQGNLSSTVIRNSLSLFLWASLTLWLFFSICTDVFFQFLCPAALCFQSPPSLGGSLLSHLLLFPVWYSLSVYLTTNNLNSVIQLVYFITPGHLLPNSIFLLTRISVFFYDFKRFIFHWRTLFKHWHVAVVHIMCTCSDMHLCTLGTGEGTNISAIGEKLRPLPVVFWGGIFGGNICHFILTIQWAERVTSDKSSVTSSTSFSCTVHTRWAKNQEENHQEQILHTFSQFKHIKVQPTWTSETIFTIYRAWTK